LSPEVSLFTSVAPCSYLDNAPYSVTVCSSDVFSDVFSCSPVDQGHVVWPTGKCVGLEWLQVAQEDVKWRTDWLSCRWNEHTVV